MIKGGKHETKCDFSRGGGYSTTEQVIGTWIGGKPVYKKVIPITLSQATNVIDASSLNVDVLVDLRAIIFQTNGNMFISPFYYNNSTYSYCLYEASKKFYVHVSSSVYYGTAYIIAEYTKTTD